MEYQTGKLLVVALGALAALCVVGNVVLQVMGKTPQQELTTIASSCITGIIGIYVRIIPSKAESVAKP